MGADGQRRYNSNVQSPNDHFHITGVLGLHRVSAIEAAAADQPAYSPSGAIDRWVKTINRGPRKGRGKGVLKMARITDLAAAVDALVAQVQATKGVQASAVTLINGFAAIVTEKVAAALDADNAADQGSIDAATAAIEAARVEATDSTNALGAAVAANQ
jgi:hypothetical protein